MKAEVTPDAQMKKGFLQATNYLNSHLNQDEFPLYRAHLSWIPVFIHQVPFMLVGSVIGGAVWGILGDFFLGCGIALIAWVIGFLSQIGQIYRNIATDILLTNQGLHSKHKLFAVEDDQFSRYGYFNDAVLDYNSILQRLFQYGDVEVNTIGDGADYIFKSLAKPQAFKSAVRAAQQKYGMGGMPGPMGAPMGGGYRGGGYGGAPMQDGRGRRRSAQGRARQQYNPYDDGYYDDGYDSDYDDGYSSSGYDDERYDDEAYAADFAPPVSGPKRKPARQTSGAGRQRKRGGQRRRGGNGH